MLRGHSQILRDWNQHLSSPHNVNGCYGGVNHYVLVARGPRFCRVDSRHPLGYFWALEVWRMMRKPRLWTSSLPLIDLFFKESCHAIPRLQNTRLC